MVLSREIEDLTQEIRAAEETRDRRVGSFKSDVEAFHSPAFTRGNSEIGDDGIGSDVYHPENFGYSFVSRMLPQLVFTNPRVRVKSKTGKKGEPIAQAMKHGLNRWVMENELADFLLGPTTDGLFSYGVVLVTTGEHPTYEHDGRSTAWPQVERISPRMHFRDPLALTGRKCRYEGHAWVIDHKDLKDQAKADNKDMEEGDVGKWYLDAIGDLTSGIQDDTLHQREGQGAPDRKQVRVYDLYIPDEDYDLEDFPRKEGWNGVILTLAQGATEDGELVVIREERPYFGHRSGPYAKFEVYQVPDDPFGMSPMTPISGMVEDLNRHMRAVGRNSDNRKKFMVVDETEKNIAEKIRDIEDDGVVAINGFKRDSVMDVEVGGITEQQIGYVQWFRELVERISGMQEAQRGGITGKGTATEAAIADEASDIREDFIKERHHKFVMDILRKVAFQFHHMEDVIFPLDAEASQAIAQAAAQSGIPPEMIPDSFLFQGGEEEGGMSFDDMEYEIEPQSMERTSEGLQQRREIELTGVLLQIAAASAQFPQFDWQKVLEDLGESFNKPGFGELFNPEIAAQLLGIQLQSQTDQPEGKTKTQASAEPRMQLVGQSTGGALGGDVNAGGMSA